MTQSGPDPPTKGDNAPPAAQSKPLFPHSSTSDLRERFAQIRATTAPTTPMGSPSSVPSAPVSSPLKRMRSGANRGADSSSSNGNNKKIKTAVEDAIVSAEEDIDSSDEERPIVGVGRSAGLGAAGIAWGAPGFNPNDIFAQREFSQGVKVPIRT